MLVDMKDGSCRSCNGQLEITDVDDGSMTVVCLMAKRDGIEFTGE